MPAGHFPGLLGGGGVPDKAVFTGPFVLVDSVSPSGVIWCLQGDPETGCRAPATGRCGVSCLFRKGLWSQTNMVSILGPDLLLCDFGQLLDLSELQFVMGTIIIPTC